MKTMISWLTTNVSCMPRPSAICRPRLVPEVPWCSACEGGGCLCVVVAGLALALAAFAIVFVVRDLDATGLRDEVVATPPATVTATPTEPAAVGTWSPTLGRPRLGVTASIDHTPVARPVVDALAVLRRPQSVRDRELAGPKLRYVGQGVDRVQIDGVRALSRNYPLVPVGQFGPQPGPGICLMGAGG